MARRKEIKNLFGTLYEYEYDGDKLVSFKKADDKTGKNGISAGKSNAPKKEAPKSAVKKVDDKLSSVSKSLGERVYGETTKDVTLGKDFRQDTKRLGEQKIIEKAETSKSFFDKARRNALKMDYERTDGHSRLSSTIGDDIQKLMSDYNNAKNNKVDQTAYDELRERSKKIRDDLRNYHDYYSLYNTDDAQNAKTFGDLEQLASGIHDDLHYSDDVNGFYNRKQSQGVQSYAELRRKRALLQRKRGNEGYDTDRINAELEALDKYGYNQNVIDSMTDEDWEYEKQRLQMAKDNANQKRNNLKTEKNTAAISTKYPDLNPQNKPRTESEISGELKAAENEFYYYNNLLSEVEELERTTKIEREIAKKWGDYKSKIPDGGVHAKIEAPGNGWEYNAVNYGFVPEEQIATDATGGGWVANKSEIHNAKLYNFAIADEINMYNYLHDNVSPEKATEYLKDITPILNKRMSQYESAEAYKKAQESPVFAAIGSTAYNGLFGGVEALINDAINGVTAISGKEIDPYSPRFQAYRDMQATQQGVKDTIDSKVGKLIYSAGTQIAELTISMLAAQGIGSAVGGLAKGANAAQIASKASNIANQVLLSSKSMLDTTLRYKESGESDLAAVGMGMLSGLIEAYTERKSLSNLLKSPDIFKDMATKVKVGKWASKIGVDALKEGLEEVEANALNTIAALVFDYRNNDSFLSAIDKAKAEGKSDSEALAEAIKAVAPEYIESFVVGALAGGTFGAVNTASSINTVNNVIDISSDYFGKNGTSRESVERLLIDMGYSDEAEIAKAANAIVRKGNGRSISKDNEALFEDDVRLRGMLYGYVEAVDAGARRDMVSEVLDEARETETPEPTATSVPKNTTVTKPEAELTEEEAEERKQGYALINDDDAEESYRTRGRSGSKVYTYAVNKGGLIDELIKDGYSAEEARSKTEQLFRFMYNQGRINGDADIAVKSASENIVSGYEAQAREFFVAGQMDAQGRLIGKTNARLVPNQTLKNMQRNGQINSLTVRAINALASKLGINIAFSDTMKDGDLGSFNKKTGTLLINSKAKNKYFLTAVHESIHAIRSIHPESYNKMNEIVYDILKDNKSVHNKAWNKILSSYRKEATKDGKINRDLINEELTAKVVSHLLTDEAYIKELAQTDRKGLQRIYDAIVDFFDKIFKRYSEDASPREAEFKDALKELQGEFNTIKAMYENALKETTNVQQSKMVLPESGDGANVLNSKAITKEDVANGVKSGYNKNTDQYKVMWTIEEGVLDKREVKQFYDFVGEKKRGIKFEESFEGETIFEINNKLIYADTDYLYPSISKVIIINNAELNTIEDCKEVILDGETNGITSEGNIETAEFMFGKGIVSERNFVDSEAHRREKKHRGKTRGSQASDNRSGEDVLNSKESTGDTSVENIDPGVQGTQAISDAAYFELKKEVQKKLDEHIKKYGAIKKGEDAVRDAQFPVQTSDDRYVRRFTRTAFEADSVTDEVAAEIAEEVANGSLWTTYSRITDKKSVDAALNRFKSVGYDKMLEEWEAKIASKERIEKGDIAKAMVLVQEAGKRGDMKTAMGLIAEIAAEGTRAGQLVQSLSLLKKLSGQANVYYIERTIKQIQKDIDNKYTGRKAKKHVTIKVPEDLLKKYKEMYDREKKSGSRDHSGSDKILDDIMKNVAEQIPATWADKFNTWRYFAMLGNPRTHIRNLAGNTFFMPLILAKNMVAAIGEGLAAPAAKLFGKNMQRTKTLGGVLSFGGEYMRYGKKDAQKIEAMLRGEGKYSELQKIMQGRKIFTSKVSGFLKINQLVNANAKALDNEDWIFLKHNYARALTMYMKANKLSPDTITEKQLETARLYAVREAQKASFRDESALAKAIQRAEKSHKALGFAVGALMPFKQTPINVLKRGVEYSPAGVITTVGKGIKGVYDGKFSATEFIDGLGATLSGTGLCYLGVYLASQGLLFGPGDDDEENRMNILNGIQNYSLKIGNGTYTIDWASPAAMSLFVGCEIWNSLADKEERTFADIVDALMSITEPVFEMSMLEGLMSVFEAGVYATRSSEAATEALTSIVPDYFSQFVPTILGQVARTIDPVRRKTYVDKNKNVPEWLQLFGQQMAKKFPGTSFLLDPYVNAKGETELNAEGNIFSRAMQNFFSPGYYKSIKSNEVDSEIARLYEKFGSDANGVIPKTVGRKIGDVNLSSEQYTKYQQVTGQAYYSKLKEIISSDYYQNLSDTDKVRLLKKAREYAVEKGKEETLSDYHSSEGWLMKAFETDGLYRHVLNEVKEGKFSEEDLVGDAREFYEEEKDKIFSDILAEYNTDKLDYELADKFYEDLYDLSEKIALEANSDGQYVIEDTWINNAKELEAEERAQYIYGRAILTQYDDQDKANDALQNDSFISDKVRGYLLQKSFGGNDNPSKLYSNHVARHSNEISFEEYTKLWEKWEAAEKYKVGNKTIDKKDQVLPEINKLKISNEAKSRIYDSFGWGNSEKALKNVPWSYVPDSQSPDVLSKRVGNTIANIKSSAYNNDADYGQCVWYARGRAKELLGKNIPAMGNANQMFANAKKNSKVEAKPENLKANMLVTYNKGTSTAGQYAGHVIYIEAVDGDTVYYSEGGSLKISGILRKATKDQIMKGITNDRKLGSDIIGFIDVTKY